MHTERLIIVVDSGHCCYIHSVGCIVTAHQWGPNRSGDPYSSHLVPSCVPLLSQNQISQHCLPHVQNWWTLESLLCIGMKYYDDNYEE